MVGRGLALLWLGGLGCGGSAPGSQAEGAADASVPAEPVRVSTSADLPGEPAEVIAHGGFARGSFRGATRPEPVLVLDDGARVRLAGTLPSSRWLGRRLRLSGAWQPDATLGPPDGVLTLEGGAQDVLGAHPAGLMMRDAAARLPEHLEKRGLQAVWPPLDGPVGDRGHGAVYLATDADGILHVVRVATDGEARISLGVVGEVRDVVGVPDDEGLHLDLAVRLVQDGVGSWRVLRDRDGSLRRVEDREERLARAYDRGGLYEALGVDPPADLDPQRLVEIARSCNSTQVPDEVLHFTGSRIRRAEGGAWSVRLQSEEGREVRLVVEDAPPRCNNLRRPTGPIPAHSDERASAWSRALRCAEAEPYAGTDLSGAPLLVDAAVMDVDGDRVTVTIPGFGSDAPGLSLRIEEGLCKQVRD